MTDKLTSVEDDLAFMRSLAQPSDASQRVFGQLYFAAGLCYSVQMAGHAIHALAGLQGPFWGFLIGAGPSVVFLIALVWILRRNRGAPPPVATSKAVGAIFRAVGLANLFLVVVVGSIAWREQSLTIWLIYPCTVMVLQGAAWLAAYYLRRQPWLAVVAYGWLLTGVAMALSVDNNLAFIAATGFGLFAFMLVPGAVIMRQRGD